MEIDSKEGSMNALIEHLKREAKTDEDSRKLKVEVAKQRREFTLGWPVE